MYLWPSPPVPQLSEQIMHEVQSGKGVDKREIPNEGSNAAPLGPGLAIRVESSDRPPANWCTLDQESIRAIAETNAEGDKRYGTDNWMKGIPASNLLNHALDHLFRLLDGNSDEPHIEHAMWNLGKLRWMAKNKPEMIDLPRIRKALGLDRILEGKDADST